MTIKCSCGNTIPIGEIEPNDDDKNSNILNLYKSRYIKFTEDEIIITCKKCGKKHEL